MYPHHVAAGVVLPPGARIALSVTSPLAILQGLLRGCQEPEPTVNRSMPHWNYLFGCTSWTLDDCLLHARAKGNRQDGGVSV